MNERELDIMANLLIHERNGRQHGIRPAARPMDVGAWNGSYHSATLMRMERKGWVRNVGHGHSSGGSRGSRRTCMYRSTEAGRTLYRELAADRAKGANNPTRALELLNALLEGAETDAEVTAKIEARKAEMTAWVQGLTSHE